MTPRQARTERRAAERKAKKAETKRLAALGQELSLEEEFSPELIAEANAARQRVQAFIDREQRPNPPISPEYGHDCAEQRHDCAEQNRGCEGAEAPPSRAEINRANAQFSTGPRSFTGKLASSRNSLKHGLASGETIIPGECPAAFEALLQALLEEHQPAAPTEELLVKEMAQSYWLAQRALRLQNECFGENGIDDKRLSLYLRYQTTHNRAFHKALNELQKLRAEKRRAEIGFVSQQHKEAAEARRQSAEKRKQDRHEWDILLAQAKTDHQTLLNMELEHRNDPGLAPLNHLKAAEKAA